MRLLQIFFFVLISNIIFGQNNVVEEKRTQFFKLFGEQEKSVNYSFDNGSKLLALAQTDYEKSLAYMIMGEGKYKTGDYVKSVEYLEKAENTIGKKDSLYANFRIVNQLLVSYRRAGLVENSNQKFSQLKKLVVNLDQQRQDYLLLVAQAKIYEIDGENCKAANIRKRFFETMLSFPMDEAFKNKYLFGVLSQLSYAEYKCGKISDARLSLQKSEDYKSKIDPKENLLLKDFYFMNKALLFQTDKNTDLSRKYFDSAVAESEKNKNNLILKLILSERLNANIDDADTQLKFARVVKNISDAETRVTKDLISKESKKAFEIIEDRERNQNLLIVAIALVLLAIGVGAIFYFKNLKKVKANYQKIIDDLQQDSKPKNEKPVENFISDVKMSTETEKSLLQSLEKFEDKNLFTKSSISLAQMAVLLNTNTKYLNYILKKYRNADFNTYINASRINYITKELHSNPKLKNFKISALAEKCGFGSHSQFTSVFKAKTQISPSQFISRLKQEQA